jgi:hypothetical protein
MALPWATSPRRARRANNSTLDLAAGLLGQSVEPFRLFRMWRQPDGSVGPERIHAVGFVLLPEGAVVHVPNRRNVFRTFRANLDGLGHRAETIPVAAR